LRRVRRSGGFVDDAAWTRDPIMLLIFPLTLQGVDDDGPTVVMARQFGIRRRLQQGDDLASDRVGLEEFDLDARRDAKRYPRHRFVGNAARLDMFKEHCFLRFPDFGPSDGRYDVTRLLCVRLSQLRQSLRRDPASAVLSNNAATGGTIGIGSLGRTLVSSRWLAHAKSDRSRARQSVPRPLRVDNPARVPANRGY